MNKNDLYYLALINKEFDFLSINSIKTMKSQNKISYKELYFNIVDRYKVLEECQEACVDISPMDIYPVVKCRVKSNLFLKNLYASRDQLVRSSFITKTKKILDYINSSNFKKHRRNSMTAIAKEFRLSPYFFTYIKKLSKNKYNLIMSFHKDKYESVYVFRNEMLKVMIKCIVFTRSNPELSKHMFFKDKSAKRKAKYLKFIETLNFKEPLLLQHRQLVEILSFENKIKELTND